MAGGRVPQRQGKNLPNGPLDGHRILCLRGLKILKNLFILSFVPLPCSSMRNDRGLMGGDDVKSHDGHSGSPDGAVDRPRDHSGPPPGLQRYWFNCLAAVKIRSMLSVWRTHPARFDARLRAAEVDGESGSQGRGNERPHFFLSLPTTSNQTGRVDGRHRFGRN